MLINQLEENSENIDIIDIGGESTKPNSEEIEPKEEFDRIIPLLKLISSNKILNKKIISIDTRKVLQTLIF